MSEPQKRPLTEDEVADQGRVPLRAYSFTCNCGCPIFTADWAMYSDLRGHSRMFCFDCGRECIPTEPMEYRA